MPGGGPSETEAFAPAKINLTLHVTGRRADGYHLLDSLVVFAACGDRVFARADRRAHLTVTGPAAAGVPLDENNLVLQAARHLSPGRGAALVLEKHLPTASGIGGGSADAAAALRALARLWGVALPNAAAVLSLGADVPVCLASRAARMTGIGEGLAAVPPLPPVWLVLANPGVTVATPAVFAALRHADNAPMPPHIPAFADAAALAGWLADMRNDLEPAAAALEPAIGAVTAALTAQPGCLLARMSGSGATCFGLFGNAAAADHAARTLAREQPGWWVRSAPLWTTPF